MQAIHAPLIPQTGITHVLFLRQFTASAKYDKQVVGNVVVAGGERMRVYDLLLSSTHGEADGKEARNGLRMRKVWDQRGAGEVTGLQSVKLVGGEGEKVVVAWGAKLSILEWSGGEVSTVSLHTFERASQVLYANPEDFLPLLCTDPQDKMIVQLLPEDSLAIIPLVQDMEELEGFDSTSVRDVPYMPSFILSLPELSSTLRNVKDLAFLPGFNNPTLAILFCPNPTATGRTTVPRDTYHIEIRTLDPLGQTYPLISSTEDLPSDSQYIVPCPQGIGGVLLITATAVFHVDQSGKYVCTSSNGWFKFVSNITPTRRREECLLELDGSHVVWADEGNFLMVLRDSTVIQARLEVEGRSVVGIDFLSPLGLEGMESPSAPKVGLDLGLEQPSSVCGIALSPSENGLTRSAFFAASAVGDSCLVTVNMVPEETSGEEAMNGTIESKPEEMQVDLDDDLYGDSIIRSELTRAERKLMQAHLSVTAKVRGIGYISEMAFGVTPESKSARENIPGNIPATREPEIAILQGGGKGNSTVDLIRLRTTKKRKYHELVGSANVWAVNVKLDADSMDQPQETATRLFQAQKNDDGTLGSTYVWAVDSDSGELQEILITFEEETVTAGSCLNASRIARVSTYAINILDAGKLIHVPTIKSVDIDPAYMCPDGGFIAEHHLDEFADDTDDSDPIVQADVHSEYVLVRHKSGRIFIVHLAAGPAFKVVEVERDQNRAFTSAQIFTDDSGIFRTFESKSTSDQLTSPVIGRNGRAVTRTTSVASARALDSHLLALTNVAGELEVSEQFDLSADGGLNNADQALVDDGLDRIASDHMDTSNGADPRKEEDEPLRIEQICISNIGNKDNVRPYLMVLYSTDTLLVYEAQPRFTLDSEAKTHRTSLAVRFRKVMTKVLGRPKLPRSIEAATLEDCHFACLTGSQPALLFEDDLEGLICTSWSEPINCLTALKVDGASELLLCTSEATLLQLQPRDQHDTARSCRKRLERTYTHLTYDPRSSYYVGAAAISVPYQLYNDECEPVPGPEAPNLTPAIIERSTLELFNPYSWTVVDGYEFDENEVVLCVENMVLEATSTEAGVKRYLVVGTSVNRGEDMSSKGNTYVFEIVEVVSGVDQLGDWSLRLICTEEAKGPVSALANVAQYMVQAMGQKVYVKALDKEDHLVPVAFLDVPPYITSIKVFKNLILLGDIVKGVWLAVFQETPFRLDVIAKDFYDVSVVAVDFLASEGMMTFSTVDDQGDLRLLEFNPDQSSSNEVAKLVRRTEYHIGQPVTKSLMVARRKTAEDRIAPQTQIIYADALGGVSTLIPLKAARFKRLQLLQGQVTRSVQHMAGLNPKAYRHVANRHQARALNKGVLDGFLLQTFIDLPFDKQKELVDPIGTNRETIINDLVDLSFTW
ncbi:hypothetical protein QFC22_002523 [Naganishia vaughanmartiniae]|uniref:Uncharacterized protein n=1 Tax=Naganishia vaughanmartiniae TaxID=1424756 RepID=A0ACC2X990_9TREE|nr:hypothetical protein QFC22_002523 [Naganishia vaughanmartiniae]